MLQLNWQEFYIGLTTVWVITEAADADGERSATTILLPHEY
jgi:hypothetical protein